MNLLTFSQFVFLVLVIVFVLFLILIFAKLNEFLCPCCAVAQFVSFVLSKTRTARNFFFGSFFSLQRDTSDHHARPKALY